VTTATAREARCPAVADESVEVLLEGQRRAHRADPVPSVATRRNRLDRLVLMLTECAEELSAALEADYGHRPRTANLLSDVVGILPDILLTRRRLSSWMRTSKVRGTGLIGVATVIEKRPLGVVGIIAPWNFPIALAVQPAASALAAGNRVMIKMSEVTPKTAAAFAGCVRRYFDENELTVVQGDATVGAAFSALPFDHLFFTGSPGVGRLVAQAAAANLVPVTLELGGKNPAVVAHDADIQKAAARIVAARLANGGQICLCPDDAYVPAAALDVFVDAAMAFLRERVTGLGAGVGPVASVDDRNAARVRTLIEDARAKGARVLQHDPAGSVSDLRRIPPTLLLDVTPDMQIASQEVFGPVLSVHAYNQIGEVIDSIATRPTPLAAYWYGSKGASFVEFRRRVQSGGMTIDDFALHCAMPGPFGGVGESGYGAYHGRAGFDCFTHQRTVTTSRLPFSMAQLMSPPFPARLEPALEWQVRRVRRVATRRTRKEKS